jgi:hypothetical protein
MARTRLIAINGSGGAFTAVSATTVTRRVEIVEDGSANAGVPQGLAYQIDDGSATPFTTIYTNIPTAALPAEPIVLGEKIPQGEGFGTVIGTPPDKSGGYTLAATLLINLRSATATATIVRVTEYA